MRATVVVCAGLALLATAGSAQQLSHSGSWEGEFEIFQYSFSYGEGHNYVENRDIVARDVEVWTYEYRLYQNPAGVAREELLHTNRTLSVGGPAGVKVMDYRRGVGIAFSKGGTQATEGPLDPPGPSTSLEARRILGFPCRGVQYRWTTFQHSTAVLQRWSAQNSNFKVPLLQITWLADKDGALLGLTVEVVSHLEEVHDLPATLFEWPKGLSVLRTPLIQ